MTRVHCWSPEVIISGVVNSGVFLQRPEQFSELLQRGKKHKKETCSSFGHFLPFLEIKRAFLLKPPLQKKIFSAPSFKAQDRCPPGSSTHQERVLVDHRGVHLRHLDAANAVARGPRVCCEAGGQRLLSKWNIALGGWMNDMWGVLYGRKRSTVACLCR